MGQSNGVRPWGLGLMRGRLTCWTSGHGPTVAIASGRAGSIFARFNIQGFLGKPEPNRRASRVIANSADRERVARQVDNPIRPLPVFSLAPKAHEQFGLATIGYDRNRPAKENDAGVS